MHWSCQHKFSDRSVQKGVRIKRINVRKTVDKTERTFYTCHNKTLVRRELIFMAGRMVEYTAAGNESMLVDYRRGECRDCFDLHVSENQCAFLQLGSGKKGFFEAGVHSIRLDRGRSCFRKPETVDLFWFNLDDQIELHLDDTIQVMEQLLKAVDPELKMFQPVDVRVQTHITVRIEDRVRLLKYLYGRKTRDLAPVLDKNWLQDLMTRRLHDLIEETVNRAKAKTDLSILELMELAETVEVAMINDVCSILDSLSLDLVAVRVARIAPTREGIETFHEKEAETLDWYNQVQMDRFSKRSARASGTRASRSGRKKEKATQAA